MTDRKAFALSALLIFVSAAPLAVAEGSSPPAGSAQAKAVDKRSDDQTVVCKREDVTGSRLGATKVCHTRAEWEAQAAEARSAIDRVQQSPQVPH
jgi:Flp pilus assembly protein CpaB